MYRTVKEAPPAIKWQGAGLLLRQQLQISNCLSILTLPNR